MQVFRERVSVSFHPDMPLVAYGDLMVNVNNRWADRFRAEQGRKGTAIRLPHVSG